MDSVEDYARQRAKREKEATDTLSEWIKAVRSLIQIRIRKLNVSINAHARQSSKSKMWQNTYPPDKATSKIVFVCKNHYMNYKRIRY